MLSLPRCTLVAIAATKALHGQLVSTNALISLIDKNKRLQVEIRRPQQIGPLTRHFCRASGPTVADSTSPSLLFQSDFAAEN